MEDGVIGAGTLARSRVRVWVDRYLPAELAGSAAAVLAALVAGGGLERAVVAAAWAEAIAFYAFVTAREIVQLRDSRRGVVLVLVAVRGVVAEFGVAELADTLVLRPLLMYTFAQLLGGLLPGVIAGKLASDLLFYGLAIPAYELRVRGGG